MAIKNTLLGGTDFATPSDRVKPTDLNDTFNSAAGFLTWCALNFKVYSNLVWNADLLGFSSDLIEDFENYSYDTFKDSTKIDSINSDIKGIPIFGANIMDDFEDSSIDTNIWSTSTGNNGNYTGTINETNGYLILSSSASGGSGSGVTTATANQINAEDFNRTGTLFSKIYTFKNESNAVSGSFVLIDESANAVILKSFSAVEDVGTTNSVRIEIDPATNNADVYIDDLNGEGSSTSVDLSSLVDGDVWNLELRLSGSYGGSGHAGQARFFYTRFLSNALAQNDFISETETESNTINNAILVSSEDITYGSIDYFLSADDGVNYEAVIPNEIHRFANTGTQLKVKAELNSTVDKVPILHHYSTQNNII